MQLLLFDIDGTLLRARGGGAAAIEQAVAAVTGSSASTEGVAFSGRTDPAIFRDVLRSIGLPVHDALLEEVLEAYVTSARRTIQPPNVDRLPGAARLLSLLSSRPDVFMGLVTGNVKSIAYHKLQTVGLDEYFSVGAFGSDHTNRSQLPPLAAQRAEATAGHPFPLDRTIVIGDTTRDIRCARAAGTRAVAVGTGTVDRSTLASAEPDLLFDDLANPSEIVDQLVKI